MLWTLITKHLHLIWATNVQIDVSRGAQGHRPDRYRVGQSSCSSYAIVKHEMRYHRELVTWTPMWLGNGIDSAKLYIKQGSIEL